MPVLQRHGWAAVHCSTLGDPRATDRTRKSYMNCVAFRCHPMRCGAPGAVVEHNPSSPPLLEGAQITLRVGLAEDELPQRRAENRAILDQLASQRAEHSSGAGRSEPVTDYPVSRLLRWP